MNSNVKQDQAGDFPPSRPDFVQKNGNTGKQNCVLMTQSHRDFFNFLSYHFQSLLTYTDLINLFLPPLPS